MEANEKFSVVLFSGTVDKLIAASTLVSGAAAMGKKVTVFLTYWGLVAFRKGDWQTNRRFSKDFEDYASVAMEAMQARNVPPWMDTLKMAMELGDVTVKACSQTMELFGIKLEDLEDVVSEVSGVATFVEDAQGGTTLFI